MCVSHKSWSPLQERLNFIFDMDMSYGVGGHCHKNVMQWDLKKNFELCHRRSLGLVYQFEISKLWIRDLEIVDSKVSRSRDWWFEILRFWIEDLKIVDSKSRNWGFEISRLWIQVLEIENSRSRDCGFKISRLRYRDLGIVDLRSQNWGFKI